VCSQGFCCNRFALAAALGKNSCLQSFTLRAECTQLGDEAFVALAAALGKNSCLQSFRLEADGRFSLEAGAAFVRVFEANVALQSFTVPSALVGIHNATRAYIARNRRLRRQR